MKDPTSAHRAIKGLQRIIRTKFIFDLTRRKNRIIASAENISVALENYWFTNASILATGPTSVMSVGLRSLIQAD